MVQSELITTWASLLKVKVDHLRGVPALHLYVIPITLFVDNEDASAVSRFGVTRTDILEGPDLNLKPNENLKGVGPANRTNTIPDSDGARYAIAGSMTCTNGELRLRIVHRMWNAMKAVFPKLTLADTAEVLLAPQS